MTTTAKILHIGTAAAIGLAAGILLIHDLETAAGILSAAAWVIAIYSTIKITKQ